MKTLSSFINRLFNRNLSDFNQYFIVYSNPLSPAQTSTIANRMIDKFYPNCRPNRILVSPSSGVVQLQFGSPCMQGEALKIIGEKTIEGIGSANPVKTISLNGSQIWPSQEHLTSKDQLIDLYEGQIADLTMMSKIELGDDVISEIKKLKSLINEQPR